MSVYSHNSVHALERVVHAKPDSATALHPRQNPSSLTVVYGSPPYNYVPVVQFSTAAKLYKLPVKFLLLAKESGYFAELNLDEGDRMMNYACRLCETDTSERFWFIFLSLITFCSYYYFQMHEAELQLLHLQLFFERSICPEMDKEITLAALGSELQSSDSPGDAMYGTFLLSL
ncbi:MAG: hypothetical protein LBH53_03715, partial [Puniceicoccales bacterium]|nr:hypothetical protein [Puniceicoccales bacterium]